MKFNDWVNTPEGIAELDKLRNKMQEDAENYTAEPSLTYNHTTSLMLLMREFSETAFDAGVKIGAEEERERTINIIKTT